MDRVGADFFYSMKTMVDRLGANPVAVHVPIGAEEGFEGIVDLVRMKTVRYVDSLGMKWEEETPTGELGELAADYRHRLIEAVADHDDAIMEAFLEDKPVSEAALKAAIRAATLDLSITPVLCGSAFKNKGVQPLLDAITDYLPSPLDIPPVVGVVPRTGAEETRAPSLDEPFSALAFKVMTDPYVGKLTYFRVYSVLYIKKGGVKISVLSKTGREAVVAMLGLGEFFGEGAWRGNLSGWGPRRRPSTAILSSGQESNGAPATQAACDVGSVYRTHAGPQHPDRGGPHRPAVHPSEKRLARKLLLLARYGKREQSCADIPAISQETLAKMVGTTSSRVNFFMKKFQRLGFIDYTDGLKVNSALLTVVLHD